MRIEFSPSLAKGKIKPPPSKSQIHRCVIGGGLAEGETIIDNVGSVEISDDLKATIACMENLGVRIKRIGDRLVIEGIGSEFLKKMSKKRDIIQMPCGESATTFRLLVPVCLALGLDADFICGSGLMKRPMDEFESLAEDHGFDFKESPGSYKLRGKIRPGTYRISGQISSQYISGFLMALPLLEGESTLEPLGRVKSWPYIDMTLDTMKQFGINITESDNVFHIKSSKYLPSRIEAEGDYSSASYIEALNLFGGDVQVEGLNRTSVQADKDYPKFFRMLKKERPVIDLSACPDLGPLLFAIAGAFNGGVFKGTERLAFKETDRLEKMKVNLDKLGVGMDIGDDQVQIHARGNKVGRIRPEGDLKSFGDHRLAMALSVLLTRTGGCLDGAEAVSKSYPNFFKDLEKLGIELKYLEGWTNETHRENA